MSSLSQSWHMRIWNQIMEQIHSGFAYADFPVPSSIVQKTICSETGKLAVSSCPAVTEFFDADTLTDEVCEGHYVEEEVTEEENTEGEAEGETEGAEGEVIEGGEAPVEDQPPVEPEQPVEPGQPMEPGQPVNPGESAEPEQPADPGQPVEPGQPIG